MSHLSSASDLQSADVRQKTHRAADRREIATLYASSVMEQYSAVQEVFTFGACAIGEMSYDDDIDLLLTVEDDAFRHYQAQRENCVLGTRQENFWLIDDTLSVFSGDDMGSEYIDYDRFHLDQCLTFTLDFLLEARPSYWQSDYERYAKAEASEVLNLVLFPGNWRDRVEELQHLFDLYGAGPDYTYNINCHAKLLASWHITP